MYRRGMCRRCNGIMVNASEKQNEHWALAAVGVGAASVFLSQRLAASLHWEESPLFYMLGIVVFFTASCVYRVRFSQARWTAILLILIGIPIGGLVDASYDSIFNHIDQNLWPFAMVFWWIVGIVPIALGYAVGRRIEIA